VKTVTITVDGGFGAGGGGAADPARRAAGSIRALHDPGPINQSVLSALPVPPADPRRTWETAITSNDVEVVVIDGCWPLPHGRERTVTFNPLGFVPA
jgi:hypothetical protein